MIDGKLMPLADRQRGVMEYIHAYCKENWCSPTVNEIASHFNIRPNAVTCHINFLRKKGYLKYDSARVCLTKKAKTKRAWK